MKASFDSFKAADAACAAWATEQDGGGFGGWVLWLEKGGNEIAEIGSHSTLNGAINAALAIGGLFTIKPVGWSNRPSRSIPFLHGLRCRTANGSVVAPEGCWPTEDQRELRLALGCEPSELEIQP